MNEVIETPTEILTDGEKIDRLEAALSQLPQLDHQIAHFFTPGMYLRRIIMPAGSIYTSKIHKTRHPYFVMRGLVSVRREDGTWEHIVAPHFGITEPGTRRVLAVHEETEWYTAHATEETDLEKIEEQVIEKHDFRESLPKGEQNGLV